MSGPDRGQDCPSPAHQTLRYTSREFRRRGPSGPDTGSLELPCSVRSMYRLSFSSRMNDKKTAAVSGRRDAVDQCSEDHEDPDAGHKKRKGEVPEDEDYIVPLGKANVTREGTDITVITWSREARFAEEAADKLAAEGISTEVLDLRSLVPLDWDAIVKSVSKTHNVVIVSEETKRGSYAGEISAQINEDLYDELDAPVLRVCAPNIVSPFSPVLEDLNFAQPDDIVQAVKKVLNK